ncbi:MAG: polysaccharide biosynthesis C-terminal domain-containing protein, partial [Prevotellaceae bacterium]|nr:polysaccharide biosynthesis C-terminal domain-containing protein [Prevotellaceae bacterium]
FIIFTLAAFLCVVAYLDILQYIVGKDYREGLKIVPIVMAAEIMMGIVVNLSFWYKLIDKTIYGAYFSIVGCIVLFAVNFIFIPKIGYVACAWAGFAGYGTTMVISYILGQKHNPIDYPLAQIAFYVIIAAVLFAIMKVTANYLSIAPKLGVNTILVLIFMGIILKKEKFIDAIRARKK